MYSAIPASQPGMHKVSPPPLRDVWHKGRLLNYPWVETRPAKYLGAHPLLIAEYLIKPLATRKPAQALWLGPQTSGTAHWECQTLSEPMSPKTAQCNYIQADLSLCKVFHPKYEFTAHTSSFNRLPAP